MPKLIVPQPSMKCGEETILSQKPLTTTEAGYIYHSDPYLSRVRIFHNRYSSPITYNSGTYSNSEDSESIGTEWDWKWRVNNKWNLNGALSYTHAQDDSTGEPPSGGAAWLGHGGLVYKHQAGWRIGGLMRYVGQRTREVGDTRNNLKSYLIFDLNGEIPITSLDGAKIQWGAKNIFDSDVRFPSEMIDDPDGNSIPTFSDDYPVLPRQLWIKLSWQF